MNNTIGSLIDQTIGIKYSGGRPELYREILASYYKDNKKDKLQEFFLQENWKEYRILVHAVKSTSMTIGAAGLSELARKLELAVTEEDVSYLSAHHAEMMQRYEDVLNEVKKILETAASKRPDEEEADPAERCCVLVVDDDVMNLRIAEHILESKYRVICVKSGEDALQFLSRIKPDIVLLDLLMPEMDGLEVLAKMKETEANRDIPVVMLTADDNPENEKAGRALGVTEYMQKPFMPGSLLACIERVLSK